MRRASISIALNPGFFLLASLMPSTAQAHAMSERTGDFYGGLLHPLTSLEHVLPFIALGLLLAQRGVARTQEMVLVFPAALMVGALFSRMMPQLPGVDLVNIASMVLLGLFVALARPLPVPILYVLCLVFGLSHGYANGLAITAESVVWLSIAGMGLSGLLVATYVLFGGDYLLRRDEKWLSIAVRVLGSWIAAIGIIYFGIRSASV